MIYNKSVICAKNVIRGSINSLQGATDPAGFGDAYIHVRQKMAAEEDLEASITANNRPATGLYVINPEEKRKMDRILLWQKNGAKSAVGQMTQKALGTLELAGKLHDDMAKQPPNGHPLTFGARFILLRRLRSTHFTNFLCQRLSLGQSAFTNDVLGSLALSISPSPMFKDALNVNYLSFEVPGTPGGAFNNYVAAITLDPVFNAVNVSCDEGSVRGHANIMRVPGAVEAIGDDITTICRSFDDAIA